MMETHKCISRIGFAGNPNCGKTTLFNAYTGMNLKVANWPGVTVERVEGKTTYQGRTIRVIDLPGVYSLNSYTIEETVTRRCIMDGEVDVIVNVADASSLERNLYLTLQLLELGKPVVLALNMMDIVEARGMAIDILRLSGRLGDIPVIPVSARLKTGLEELLHTALHAPPITYTVTKKYEYIEMVMAECLRFEGRSADATDRIDHWLTHPVWGAPIFAGIMAVVFFLTFTLGDVIKDYFRMFLQLCSEGITALLLQVRASPWMISLLVDGIVAGVGGILTFLPNIFVLFMALAFLEDSGYMARVAYVMNEIMGRAGLSGKSFLPMMLGFGCTVPAVMATRALASERERRRTIWIAPLMSCSAKLPVYILFAQLFFPQGAMLAASSLYLMGLVAALVTAVILHRLDGGETEDTLLIELPEYRMPNRRTVAIYVWDKVKDYLTKAGTTIFVASVFLWLLLNSGPSGFTADVSRSFAALLGECLVPVLRPAGLGNWRIAVALLSGLSAKEVVISSFSVLFGVANINAPDGMAHLHEQLAAIGFSSANAYALMIFCLLYTPCVAALGTIRRETGSWSFTLSMALFQLLTAWLAAVLAFQLGGWLF